MASVAAIVRISATCISTAAIVAASSVVRRSRAGRRRSMAGIVRRGRIVATSIVRRGRIRRSWGWGWMRWWRRRFVIASWRRARVGGRHGESASNEESGDCEELHCGEAVNKRILVWCLGDAVERR